MENLIHMTETDLSAVEDRLKHEIFQERASIKVLERAALETWANVLNQGLLEDISFLKPYLNHSPHSGQHIPAEVFSKSVKQTEKQSSWAVKDLKVTVLDVSEECHVQRRWEAEFVQKIFPNFVLSAIFETKTPIQGSTVIENLAFDLCEVNNVENQIISKPEIQTLFDHCLLFRTATPAFEHLGKYLEMAIKRQRASKEFGPNTIVDGTKFTFCNDREQPLVHFEWRFKFVGGLGTFKEIYVARFTELGTVSARDCGFPEDLLTKGKTSDWSAQYCATNLKKMTSLFTTPAKAKASKKLRQS